jgi:hypothetical protein
MAKGTQKTTGALPKTSPAPTTTATAPKTAAPTTTATAPKTAPKLLGQKQAAAQPADPVGDICLLPDIARFAH